MTKAQLGCLAFAIATLLLGCGDTPKAPQYGPTPTEADALRVATHALRTVPDARGPYRVTRDGSTWRVMTRSTTVDDYSGYSVLIDARTGKTEVGGYQTARINEKL